MENEKENRKDRRKGVKRGKCGSGNNPSDADQTHCQNPTYKFRCFGHEDHRKPICGVAFNWTLKSGEPLIFATVGSNRVSIYECGRPVYLTDKTSKSKKSTGKVNTPKELYWDKVNNPPLKVLWVYFDPEESESFYTCAWTTDKRGSSPFLAAAGRRGVIRILSLYDRNCSKSLLGHGGEINHITFHPKDSNLLLSCSLDCDLRLWNIQTGHCVAMFCGEGGHRTGVLHCSFHRLGNRFLSGGMDHTVKIWSLDVEEIKTAISKSYSWRCESAVSGDGKEWKPFPTFSQNFPQFSNTNFHKNYVDCTHWYRENIMSKESSGAGIVCWKVGRGSEKWTDVIAQNQNSKGFSFIHWFPVDNCRDWKRFEFDSENKRVALGNSIGEIYVYEMTRDFEAYPEILTHPDCKHGILQTAWSRDGDVLISVSTDSKIWVWDYNSM